MSSGRSSKSTVHHLYGESKFQIGWKVPCLWRDGKYRTSLTVLFEASLILIFFESDPTLTFPPFLDDAVIIELRKDEKSGTIEYYVHYEECT